MIFGVLSFFIGVNLRDSTLYAVKIYVNSEAGIRAEYPRNWLIDSQGDYIFRVQNASEIGFKTTMQVAVLPIGVGAAARNVLDSLTLNRSQTLASYIVLSVEPFSLPDETAATAMNYTFAVPETDPFLESLPVVVQGVDILTIKRGQAIIISFLSDSRTYKENYALFEQFINRLEF
jgi:hypothetical protein